MPALNDLAARTELRPFESLTLTDQQFLIGTRTERLSLSRPSCGCRDALRAACRRSSSHMGREAQGLARNSGRNTSMRWGSRPS